MNGTHQVILFKILFYFMWMDTLNLDTLNLDCSSQDKMPIASCFSMSKRFLLNLILEKQDHWQWKLYTSKNRTTFVLIAMISFRLLSTPGEGNGIPLQYSCLENPWTEEPGRLQSMGSLKVGHDWATSLSLFTFMHWRRKWQPAPVLSHGESQGRGSLVGCHLWGRIESDTTEAT